ncbi:MAG: hypothetical protein ACRDGQ_04600 [Candidatus Limnocylindrales bacterium]
MTVSVGRAATTSAGLVAQLVETRDPIARFGSMSSADQGQVRTYLSAAHYTTVGTLIARRGVPKAGPSGAGSLVDAAVAAMAAMATGPDLSMAMAPGAGCWTWRWERDAYNLFNQKLWAYFQEIDWCDDGHVMLGAPEVLNYGSIWFPFWSWTHAGDHVWGGAGQPSLRSWTQADFSLCLSPNIGCIQNTYPWLDMTAHANGTGSGSVG